MTWFDDMQVRITNYEDTRVQITLFDSEKVDIVSFDSIEDTWGITRNGWQVVLKDFICDIQDITDEKVAKEWGYDVKATKVMYCRPNDLITESSLIKFEEVLYKVVKIKKCKNFSDYTLDRYYKIGLIRHLQQELSVVDMPTP